MQKLNLYKSYLVLLNVLFILLFTSCSKDPATTTTTTTNGSMFNALTRNNWFPRVSISGTSDVLLPCHLDDDYDFKTDGTYEILFGATRCFVGQPASAKSSLYKFELDEANKTMMFHNFGEDIQWKIIQLDNSKMILEGNKVGNVNYKYYLEYDAI